MRLMVGKGVGTADMEIDEAALFGPGWLEVMQTEHS